MNTAVNTSAVLHKIRVRVFTHAISSCNIQEMLKELLTQYTWELVPEQDLTYKVLPVCRLKEDVTATFTRTEVSS